MQITAPLPAAMAFLIPGVTPGIAQSLIYTSSPYAWTDPCTGGHVRITVRVCKDVPNLPSLYRWDYEIYNISLRNSPPTNAWEMDAWTFTYAHNR